MMRYYRLKLSALCVFVTFLQLSANAQLLAFPTAEGAGKFVTGGRGTSSIAPKIFEVTTLADDATSATTPGTFRYACTNNSPSVPNRIIVFRVSGTIHLYAALSLNRANTTIAGQTAPGEGICIADYPVSIGANNMIIRYMRFRLGDKNQLKTNPAGCGIPVPLFSTNPSCLPTTASGADDAFGDNGSGRINVIIDHCTTGWSDDESLTIYKGDNVTVQWCIIAEPLNYSYHVESGDNDYEQHAYGGIWGGAHASFHHNLIAHIKGRGPRFDGIRNIPSENVDFRNNVIYNWIDYNTNGGEGGNYNVVNNYYKYGPGTSNASTSGVNKRNMILNPGKKTTTPTIPYGKYYLTGNYCDNSAAVTARNWLGAAFDAGSFNDSTASKVTTPFPANDINMQTAQDAYNSVLTSAGCFLPHRDTLDQRIVSDVMNRTGAVIDVQGGYPHGTPYTTSQTAWPALASGVAPTDTDHDGMPDVWETQRGLNPNNAADGNGYIATSGYSNVETYLNGDSIVAAGIVNTCVGTKVISATASGTWINAADTLHSSYLSSAYIASTDSMNLVASVLDNGNYGDFAVSYYTASTLHYDAYNHPYLNRNVTITLSNPSAITAPVAVRIYFSKAEYDALKAADNSITSLSDLRIIKVSSNTCLTSLAGSTSVIIPSASGVYGTYQNGYYLEFSTTSFSTFFITSAISAATLPLQLLSFNAVYDSRKVQLVWKTTNEVNLSRFEVERSSDATRFSTIASVTAKGAADINQYWVDDVSALQGVAYYRLKMIDNNRSFKYSNIVRVKRGDEASLVLYPNPAKRSMVVNHPLSDASSYIKVYSANGAFIKNIKVDEGIMQTELQVTDLSSGTYHLTYKTKIATLTTTFIKTK